MSRKTIEEISKMSVEELEHDLIRCGELAEDAYFELIETVETNLVKSMKLTCQWIMDLGKNCTHSLKECERLANELENVSDFDYSNNTPTQKDIDRAKAEHEALKKRIADMGCIVR
jgi:hypothetical protein